MKLLIALAFLAVASAIPQPFRLPEPAIPFVEAGAAIKETVQIVEALEAVAAPIPETPVAAPAERVSVVDAFVSDVDVAPSADLQEIAPETVKVADIPVINQDAELVRVVNVPVPIAPSELESIRVNVPKEIVRVMDLPPQYDDPMLRSN